MNRDGRRRGQVARDRRVQCPVLVKVSERDRQRNLSCRIGQEGHIEQGRRMRSLTRGEEREASEAKHARMNHELKRSRRRSLQRFLPGGSPPRDDEIPSNDPRAQQSPAPGPWDLVFRCEGGLVDLLEQSDEMPASNAQLEGGPAPVAAIPGERGQDLLTLQEIDLSA